VGVTCAMCWGSFFFPKKGLSRIRGDRGGGGAGHYKPQPSQAKPGLHADHDRAAGWLDPTVRSCLRLILRSRRVSIVHRTPRLQALGDMPSTPLNN
jgi:hypothetical protein